MIFPSLAIEISPVSSETITVILSETSLIPTAALCLVPFPFQSLHYRLVEDSRLLHDPVVVNDHRAIMEWCIVFKDIDQKLAADLRINWNSCTLILSKSLLLFAVRSVLLSLPFPSQSLLLISLAEFLLYIPVLPDGYL